jgi:pro-apoptotic serine protease NMA111
VSFDMPYSVSGISDRNYYGTGLLVDTVRGLVVVDRNTVPVSVGDVRLTFGGTLEVPGKVEYIHPLHNFAVVSFDPALISDTPVRAAALSKREFTVAENVWVVGLARDGEMKVRETQIGDVEPIVLPLSRSLQFRDSNIEGASLTTSVGTEDGVIVDRKGEVLGMWSSFAYESGREMQQLSRGIAIELVADMIDRLRQSKPLHSLDVELATMPLATASRLGLPAGWLQRLETASPTERHALTIARLVGGSDASRRLRQGDLLLAIDGKVMTRFRDVERAAADLKTVQVTVWRGDAERTLEVRTTELNGIDLDRIVMWAGATLQAPHRAMLAQRGMPAEGVYVGYFAYGSPATRHGLFPGRRIVEVAGKQDREAVRLRTIAWNNAPEVITLKLDQRYFPTYELRRGASGWERIELDR